jgi:type IV fimbrial biogenesis protein FimT
MGYTPKDNSTGFTLVELLTALTLTAILASMAIPSFYSLAQRTRANATMRSLATILHFARQVAVTENTEIMLCASTNSSDCSRHWRNAELLVFRDDNRNRRLDNGETVYHREAITDENATIDWRASGNRPYLRYLPGGAVKEFGHFLYCPGNGNPRYARALIISYTGRPRSARDYDGDGIRETRPGQSLACS